MTSRGTAWHVVACTALAFAACSSEPVLVVDAAIDGSPADAAIDGSPADAAIDGSSADAITDGRADVDAGLDADLCTPARNCAFEAGCMCCGLCEGPWHCDCVDFGIPTGDGAVADAASDAGPAVTYSTWTDCGWGADAGTCSCGGLADCTAVSEGVPEPLGSHETRVCGRHGTTCDVAYFAEVEGGGTVYRCAVQVTGTCGAIDVARDCTVVLDCNLLMATCPTSVVPPSVIACSDVFPP